MPGLFIYDFENYRCEPHTYDIDTIHPVFRVGFYAGFCIPARDLLVVFFIAGDQQLSLIFLILTDWRRGADVSNWRASQNYIIGITFVLFFSHVLHIKPASPVVEIIVNRVVAPKVDFVSSKIPQGTFSSHKITCQKCKSNKKTMEFLQTKSHAKSARAKKREVFLE